jgi:hypothetical protein
VASYGLPSRFVKAAQMFHERVLVHER